MMTQMVPRNTISAVAEVTGKLSPRAAAGRTGLLQVWLVDDSENFRTLLGALLEDEGGMECARQFPTAEAVIAALEKETPPDVILLDIRMPGMGGVAAVSPIKRLAPATHVIMLTTFFDSQAKHKSLRDGAADLLLKSISAEEIASRVRLVCSHPELFPREDILAPTEEPHSSSWSERRVAEATIDRLNSLDAEQKPERDSEQKCAANRWARGVNYLRSLVQGMVRDRGELPTEAK